jgi:hypothetical protein
LKQRILLVRHGRPLCDERTPIRGTDFGAWVHAYDEAPLDASLGQGWIGTRPGVGYWGHAELFPSGSL